MSAGPTDDADTPAERRVHGLLAELQAAAPVPGTDIVPRVVRRARWQRPLRSLLDVTGGIVGAVAKAASLLFGGGRSRRGGVSS